MGKQGGRECGEEGGGGLLYAKLEARRRVLVAMAQEWRHGWGAMAGKYSPHALVRGYAT